MSVCPQPRAVYITIKKLPQLFSPTTAKNQINYRAMLAKSRGWEKNCHLPNSSLHLDPAGPSKACPGTYSDPDRHKIFWLPYKSFWHNHSRAFTVISFFGCLVLSISLSPTRLPQPQSSILVDHHRNLTFQTKTVPKANFKMMLTSMRLASHIMSCRVFEKLFIETESQQKLSGLSFHDLYNTS